MYDKKVWAGSYLVTALGLICAGILLIIFHDNALNWLYVLLGVLLIGLAAFTCLRAVFAGHGRQNRLLLVLQALLFASLGILLLTLPNLFIALLPLVSSLYCLINSLVRLITYIQLRKVGEKHRGLLLPAALVSFAFFLVLIVNPFGYVGFLLIVVGIYLIVYGVVTLVDFISETCPDFFARHVIAKLHISLPAFLCAFLPHMVLTAINKKLADGPADGTEFEQHKDAEPPDLEIFVHVAPKGPGTMGHADLWFDGEVISYGSYDESTIHFWGAIGDGCYYKTENREAYIQFCMDYEEKTMFVYGLRLTDAQKALIRQELAKIEADTFRWYTPVERDTMKKKPKATYDDYASSIHQEAGTVFYKFRRSSWKKYFVMGTNCVRLPERLLRKSGTGLLAYTGIITPGTFYEYLNGEFLKQNSQVISRAVYSNDIAKKTGRKKGTLFGMSGGIRTRGKGQKGREPRK